MEAHSIKELLGPTTGGLKRMGDKSMSKGGLDVVRERIRGDNKSTVNVPFELEDLERGGADDLTSMRTMQDEKFKALVDG